MRFRSLRLIVISIWMSALACGGGSQAPRVVPKSGGAVGAPQCSMRPGSKAVALSAEEAAARNGFGAERFSQVPSSLERPIEVCGVEGEVQWLMRAKCDDGTNPFASRQQAHGARRGGSSIGGRCAKHIDRYKVACPEKTYEIYMDLYMCGPNESAPPAMTIGAHPMARGVLMAMTSMSYAVRICVDPKARGCSLTGEACVRRIGDAVLHADKFDGTVLSGPDQLRWVKEVGEPAALRAVTQSVGARDCTPGAADLRGAIQLRQEGGVPCLRLASDTTPCTGATP